MGITIKELAQISGYSTATICRVIQNKPNIKESTRKEIEELLMKYNYRTSIWELRQAEMNSKKIMVIIGDLTNRYYVDIFTGMKKSTKETEYSMYIVYSDNDENQEIEFLEQAIREKYAGVIFMNVRGGGKIRDLLKDNHFPAVFLNRGIKHAYFNTVTNDNYQGGYQATEYLIKAGHKKIGHLAGSYFSATALERCRGFEDAMRDNGMVITNNSIYQGNIDWKSGYDFGKMMIQKNWDFTALFVSAYQMTEGLMDCFKEYGVRIPNDVSIVSFDETPSMGRSGITTICAEPEKMGETALRLLRKQMAGGEIDSERIHLEPVLKVRESVKVLKRE
ncbi:Catabolite control protein A [Dorea longicatena]|uniref:Catabolite control protein A n=1 Tax=Dorea longicatena TaxID=88431 RepID=A0A564SKE4_9FIRM|nr:LacI family DNA-binding transcriptional regulator [Dorea longicatena]VUW95283.1 Catabolite control protein A [Dorea longicatena]